MMDMNELEDGNNIRNCPICGSKPKLVTIPYQEGKGRLNHGYRYVCDRCRLLKGNETTDMYDHRADLPWPEAKELALDYWNGLVGIVEDYLKRAGWTRTTIPEDNQREE